MSRITDIIGDVTAAVLLTVIVDAVGAVTAKEFVVTSSDTSWLTTGRSLAIEGSQYKVTALTQNVSFTLKQQEHTNVISVANFIIPAPFYFHGTHIMISNERDGKKDYKDKVPALWLVEIIRENINLDRLASVDRESTLKILLFADAKYTQWKTGDHYANVLDPLEVYMLAWIEELRANRNIDELDGTAEQIKHANIGRIDATGHIESLFNEFSDGIELNIIVPVIKC